MERGDAAGAPIYRQAEMIAVRCLRGAARAGPMAVLQAVCVDLVGEKSHLSL